MVIFLGGVTFELSWSSHCLPDENSYDCQARPELIVLCPGPLYQSDVKMAFMVLIMPFKNMTRLQRKFCHNADPVCGCIDHLPM